MLFCTRDLNEIYMGDKGRVQIKVRPGSRMKVLGQEVNRGRSHGTLETFVRTWALFPVTQEVLEGSEQRGMTRSAF